MRVALFSETYLPYLNGVVTHLKVLKEGLEALGHQVLIVTADTGAKRHFIKDGVLHCPSHSIKRIYGYGLSSPISHVRMKMLESFAPDIIHVHNEFGIGLFGVSAAKRLRKPLVYTLHSVYEEAFYYIAPEPLVPLVRALTRAYARFITGRAAALTGPSRKVEEFFRQCGITKPVNYIPNSVEYELFDPERTSPERRAQLRASLGIPADAFVALFVGRMSREKGIEPLLRYWAQTIRPSDGMRLVLIGGGPEEEEFRKLAKELGITDTVVFAGKIPHEEIPPYYAMADVYITASLSEMMSISMLEAMASGLPVLQKTDPLNTDQIKEGENGFFFDGAEEMARILFELQALSPERMQDLHRRVRESVKSLSARNLAEYMVGVYQKAIEENEKMLSSGLQERSVRRLRIRR